METLDVAALSRLGVILLLTAFVPLTGLTYCSVRRKQRAAEIRRLLTQLKLNKDFREIHEVQQYNWQYGLAVFFAWLLSTSGLLVLFGAEGQSIAGLAALTLGDAAYPRAGSRTVFAMAFVGGYLWGLQHLFRRYAQNDLIPSVYYSLSLRMIMAAVIALVIYNAYGALAGVEGQQTAVDATLWPAMGFLIGLFPQRGLNWLVKRAPIFSTESELGAQPAPLEMIQGVNMHDVLRLQEVGIDDCYDLANADFIPLVLKTPYSARELADWILQAKLCAYVGESVSDLRQQGIRTITDLVEHQGKDAPKQTLEQLAAETRTTFSNLSRARDSVVGNVEIQRLREAATRLGQFWDASPHEGARQKD
ncbi:MAG: hypothetical protein ACPGZP_11365 [Panacagrimonas sp.]